MSTYKTVTTITDNGPYISKLILDMPCTVYSEGIHPDMFNVYVERKDRNTGEIILSGDPLTPDLKYPAKGYQKIKAAYPCDTNGVLLSEGVHVALELPEEKLGRPIEGGLLLSRYIDLDYRISLLNDLPWHEPAAKHASNQKTGLKESVIPGFPVNGLVFNQCTGDLCPQLENWKSMNAPKEKEEDDLLVLGYGYYTPSPLPKRKLPLVVWLRGAGEGGHDTKIAYTGTKVCAISEPDIQRKLGGSSWVLVPQCPTVWMDDGKEQLGRSNQSIYVKPVTCSTT